MRITAVRSRDVVVAGVTALLAAAVEVGLRTLPLPRVASAVGVPLELTQPGVPDVTWPGLDERERRAVRVVLRLLTMRPFDGTCLRRSLLCGFWLRAHRPVLRLGVAKVDGAVVAHAWLEIRGIALDPGAREFRVLTAQPARPEEAE